MGREWGAKIIKAARGAGEITEAHGCLPSLWRKASMWPRGHAGRVSGKWCVMRHVGWFQAQRGHASGIMGPCTAAGGGGGGGSLHSGVGIRR